MDEHYTSIYLLSKEFFFILFLYDCIYKLKLRLSLFLNTKKIINFLFFNHLRQIIFLNVYLLNNVIHQDLIISY